MSFPGPRILLLSGSCLLVAGALVVPLPAGSASAAATTLYVSTTGTNSGNCQSPSTPCATISYAVSQAASGDTIQVASGTYHDIVTIPSSLTGLTITGPAGGATVDAVPTTAQIGSVFAVENLASVTINDLTISQGGGVWFSTRAEGGGVFVSSGGTANLTNDTVSNNVPSRFVGTTVQPIIGGGIFSSGTLHLTNVTVSGNQANDTGGGGILTTTGSTTTITDSTISGNNGEDSGGGIYNSGSMVVDDSTIVNNIAPFTELGADTGGGIYNAAGTVQLNADTFSGNAAGIADGIGTGSGTTTSLAGTVIQETSGYSCTIASGSTWNDDGYNLSGDTTCNLTAASSLSSTNAHLGSLASNGGPTQTELPAAGSPAIDRIPNPTTADGSSLCPGTDQRGTSRPQGATCDMGAVEVAESAVPPSISGTPPTPAIVGQAYSYHFTLGGSPAPTTSVTAGTLPAGLSLSSSGVLSGTPTTPGTFPVTVTASNGINPKAVDTFTLTVVSSLLHVVTTSLPTATAGQSFTGNLVASGGTTPYKWSKVGGALPAGLRVTAAGVVSGKVGKKDAPGSYSVTVQVKDASAPSQTATGTVTIAVASAITAVTFSGTVATPTIKVTGAGFGSSAPSPSYPPGPCPNRGTGSLFGTSFHIDDTSGATWGAGNGGPDSLGDCIGLVVQSWTPTRVVFGFGNDYAGTGPWFLNAGDGYQVTILGATASGTVAYSK